MINIGALNTVILMKGDGAKAAGKAAKFDKENPYADGQAATGKTGPVKRQYLDYDGNPIKGGSKNRTAKFDRTNPYVDKPTVRRFDNYDGTPSNVTVGGQKKTRHFDPYPEK